MTIGILSWKSHKTLINSLESYKNYGLSDQERFIFFQEISDEDEEIARRYGYTPIGSKTNVGIANGFAELVRHATGEFFIFLENDWELLDYPHAQIMAGALLIEYGGGDVVRFRHRRKPGEPIWSQQFAGKELTRPEYLLESVYWDEPGVKFEDKVTIKNIQLKVSEGVYIDNYFSMTDAKYAAWSNNPFIAKTKLLRDTLLPQIEGDIEKAINDWWIEQPYKVAHANPGLFTHNRLDR